MSIKHNTVLSQYESAFTVLEVTMIGYEWQQIPTLHYHIVSPEGEILVTLKGSEKWHMAQVMCDALNEKRLGLVGVEEVEAEEVA